MTTVSHVINRTRHVAPETRRRVMEAIRDLKFYVDMHARNMARGKSDYFGLIVSDIGNPFFPELIKSFETAAIERGFDILLCNTNYDSQRTQAAVRKMIENKVRGVAVMTSELNPLIAEALTAHTVPAVFLDVGSVGNLTSNIRVDYAAGIFQAISYLYGSDHREFCFISAPQEFHSVGLRRKAFVAALDEHALSSRWIIEGNRRIDGGIAAVRKLLEHDRFPTAILCHNDLTALGAISELTKAGARVPEDFSVVGFDDIDLAGIAQPPLSTIRLSREQLGKLAFKSLDKMLRSKKRRGEEFVVESQFVIRESTGRVRDSKSPLSVSRPALQ